MNVCCLLQPEIAGLSYDDVLSQVHTDTAGQLYTHTHTQHTHTHTLQAVVMGSYHVC